jgi:transcriptional regulator with XRE-family HTH domain
MDWDWTALATALRDRRKALRLTQEELADQAGVHTATVKDYEAGKTYTRMPKSWAALEHVLGWAPGSARAVLEGGEPTFNADPMGEYPPGPDSHQPLSGLPASVLDQLTAGEVYATDIHDLSQEGGITIITVAVRKPGEPGEQISAEQRRRDFRAWDRVQRQLNGLPPLKWEPGDPEEWKQHPEERQA